MKRRLFTILSAASLVLCLLTVVFWGMSYLAPVGVASVTECSTASGGQAYHSETAVLSVSGVLAITTEHTWGVFLDDTPPIFLEPRHRWEFGREVADRQRLWDTWLGFSWIGPAKMILRPRIHAQRSIPIWLLALGTAVVPYFAWGRRQRNRGPGLCRSCGYDLRATPDRCPECGTRVGLGQD